MRKKWAGWGVALLLCFTTIPGKAQICSATNSYGCGIDWFSAVKVTNSSGSSMSFTGLTCANTGNTNRLMTTGPALDITPGEELEFEIENTCNYTEDAAVWIDLNKDNQFQNNECISGPTGPLSRIGSKTTRKAKVTIPCLSLASGTAILRIRCFYLTGWNAGNGCGTLNNYGNIMDFEINLKPATVPPADFTVPGGPNYVKTPVTFNSAVQNNAFKQIWTFDQGTAVVPAGPKGKGKWTNAGTYDVKLFMEYCGLKDSITKSVKIVAPTSAPTADFIASTNLIEIFEDVQMFDLSSNGAHTWAWEVTSPTGNLYTSSVQSPYFTMDEEGKWDFCLTAQNDIGPSSKLCKLKYVECTPPGEFYLGPNKSGGNKKGKLYDNGGPTGNYGNNRKVTIDYFKILPCGAKEIRLSFEQLKLFDGDAGDKLKIYDGEDEGGILLTPKEGINGTNYKTYRTSVFKAVSGAMYITFEANASGNDSGFIAVWDSDLLPPVAPVVSWTTLYNPAANGMAVTFNSSVINAQGNIDYEWILDQNPYMGFNPDFNYAFTTDGTYEVCAVAATCNGADTFCDNITIVTPTGPGTLDFTANKLRPNIGENVQLTTTTDYANAFEWSIFPLTYVYVSGAANSRNPVIKFTAGGCYTFTLKAWNSAGGQTQTEKKVIKNKFICVMDYCIPPVDLLSSDVGINQVILTSDIKTLIDNASTSGVVAYSNYTDSVTAILTYGATYDVEVSRKTFSNTMNYKVWIDFNIDGDFNDFNEEVLNSGVISGTNAKATFTVPPLSQAFEGKTRMRVGAAYANFTNTPCGVNIVGEFEDYGIILANDNKPPYIILKHSDTLRVEKTGSANSCHADIAGVDFFGLDSTEGDLTNKVVVNSDLDCTVPGIYSICFDLTDASGNRARTVCHTIIVVLDKTAPVLTLNGASPMYVEQCDVFTDPGAVAIDAVDGNLSTAVQITGTVNSSVTGTYTLTYTVSDAQGNTNSITRDVIVQDTRKPGIKMRGTAIADNDIIQVQIKSVFVDEVYAEDTCNGIIPVNKVPGFNGPVNSQVRATYPVQYFAKDPSGNIAIENGFTLLYKVDDFISPEINLNTDDTILHDVNTPYNSKPVTITDNYFTQDKLSVTKTGSVDPYVLGLYTETFTATDESGNTTIRNRYVKVVDRVAPSLIAPAVNACVGSPFWAMQGLIISDNYYSPADLFNLVKIGKSNVNIWEAGIYYINYELTDPSGNMALTATRTVHVGYPPNCTNTFSGVDQLSLRDAVNVYPNPTSGILNISYTLNNSDPVHIAVYSMIGALVYESTTEGEGFGHKTIDLSNQGKGTYTVEVTNKKEKVTKLVVVQ